MSPNPFFLHASGCQQCANQMEPCRIGQQLLEQLVTAAGDGGVLPARQRSDLELDEALFVGPADAALVAPREPQLTQYAMQKRCQNDCHDIGCMDDTPHQCHDFQCRQWPVYLASEVDALVAGLRQALADEESTAERWRDRAFAAHEVLAGLRALIAQLRQRATDDEEIAREAEEKNLLVTAGASDARASVFRDIAAELDQWLAQALAGRTETP